MYKVSGSRTCGASGTRLPWSTGSTSPTIRGRMEKTQNGCLSERGIGRGAGMSAVLLSMRKNPSLWSGGDHPTTGREGFRWPWLTDL
jgi:hypothetical protein